MRYEPLPQLQRPLLDKFYRTHGSPMRAGHLGQPWVARHGEIVAALCLTPTAQGHWLTGLFVAPSARRQAIASTLVRQALGQLDGPVWLFCHPELAGFYQLLGFQPCPQLPAALRDRLVRYSRSKALVAMQADGVSRVARGAVVSARHGITKSVRS